MESIQLGWVNGMKQFVRRYGTTLASALIVVLVLYALYHLLRSISYDDIRDAAEDLSSSQIILAILATAGSFLALSGYDSSALHYIGVRLPYRTIALASFCGYALTNTIGFGYISGSSVRYRLYLDAGLDDQQVAKVIAFCFLAFACGIYVVAGVVLIAHPEELARLLGLSSRVLRAAGALTVIPFIFFIILTIVRREPIKIGSWRLLLPSWQIVLGQLLISVADITVSGLVLYLLMPDAGIPFLAFLGVYTLAIVAGVISHVPAGLGVFETIMLLAFSDQIPAHNLSVALIAYRIIYYLLPLLLAAMLLTGWELAERTPVVSAGLRVLRRVSHLVPTVISLLTFLSGGVLLWSSATPAVPERLEALQDIVPLFVVELSHVLAVAVGVALLIIARGLWRKLNGAYLLALVLCLAGGVFSLTKGIDYEEGLVLAITATVLYLSRRQFYRHTALLDAPFTPTWLVAVIGVVGGMCALTLFAYKDVDYAHELWWQFEYEAEVSRSIRGVLFTTILLLATAVLALLRPPRRMPAMPGQAELARVETIIRSQNRTEAILALLGDKHFLFSKPADAFIMYGMQGASFIALGDPVGTEKSFEELAWQFRELADRQAARVAFYLTRPETLPLYLDMGLTPFKLGEEANINLKTFSLAGGQRKGLRQSTTKAERDGLVFEYLAHPFQPSLLKEVATVSNEWLRTKNTREKRFSMGSFILDYISHGDLAVVRENGQISAFATLMTTDTRTETSVDLMRHRDGAAPATMIFLFVKLLLFFQEQGYARFNLGMAPLSGLENHPLAPLWHRFGHLLFNRGERFYNFQGLRQFKEKFDPQWEPRYLMCEGGLNPLLVMADTAALISGGPVGILSK